MVRVLPELPVGGDGADPVLLEHRLTLAQNGFHLGDDPVDPVGFGPGGHTADMREALEVHQAAATEIDAVELHLAGVCVAAADSSMVCRNVDLPV